MLFHPDWMENAPIPKYTDFALLYLFYAWINHLMTNNVFFHKKQFPIYRCFLILTIYLTIEFIITIVLQYESFGFALKTYRNYLFFLSYIIFIDMSPSQIKRSLVYISTTTFLTSILYVTQPIHNLPILSGYISRNSVEFGDHLNLRYRNIPELHYFLLIYATIKFKLYNYKSILAIGILGISLVLTQHRGVMMGYAITVILYILFDKRPGRIVQFILIGLIGFLMIGNIVINRFENKGQTSTIDDIKTAFRTDYARAAAMDYDDEGGTLTFRILLLVERFDYFKNHPQYMLTGIGMRHEDSPKTSKDFHFILGSGKYDPKTRQRIYQQIESGDLAWFTPFMKYGIIGLALHVYVTYIVILFLIKNKRKGTIAMTTCLYYMLLILISMKNAMLFAPVQVSFLLMLIELIRKNKIDNMADRLKYQEFKLLGKKWV